MKITIAACILALGTTIAACGKKNTLDACAGFVGTCGPNSTSCGAEFSCPDGTKYALKCTAPASKPPLTCQCLQNDVVQKSAQIAADFSGQDDARDKAATACGWPRR